MTEQSLIKSRFKKSLKTYNDNAIIQHRMAKTLVDLLPVENYNSILEIGCGTGFLTKELSARIKYNRYTANDLIEECEELAKQFIPFCKFAQGDITKINIFEKYDLIISNAVFQWISNLPETIEKLKQHLNPGGMIAFSSFGKQNFYELKKVFNIGLEYPELEDTIKREHFTLEFNSLLDMIYHIKSTGVNAITNYHLTKSMLKRFEKEYFKTYGGIKLTYNPIYVQINIPD